MIQIKLQDFRCENCKKLLGRYLGCRQLEIKCPRCGSSNYIKDNLIWTKNLDKAVSLPH